MTKMISDAVGYISICNAENEQIPKDKIKISPSPKITISSFD